LGKFLAGFGAPLGSLGEFTLETPHHTYARAKVKEFVQVWFYCFQVEQQQIQFLVNDGTEGREERSGADSATNLIVENAQDFWAGRRLFHSCSAGTAPCWREMLPSAFNSILAFGIFERQKFPVACP